MKRKDIRKWDTKWSKAVKIKAKERCEYCGATGKYLQSHHWFGRRHFVTRFDVSNGSCLCAGCHFKAEQNSLVMAQWIIKKRGKKWYDELQGLSEKLAKDCPDIIGSCLDEIEEVLDEIR